MTAAIRWSQRAASHLEEAARYFEAARAGSGIQFVDDVAATLERAAIHPMANPQIPGESESTRKAVVPRYGYWVIYEVRHEAIIVLTIWSATRQPDTWRTE